MEQQTVINRQAGSHREMADIVIAMYVKSLMLVTAAACNLR